MARSRSEVASLRPRQRRRDPRGQIIILITSLLTRILTGTSEWHEDLPLLFPPLLVLKQHKTTLPWWCITEQLHCELRCKDFEPATFQWGEGNQLKRKRVQLQGGGGKLPPLGDKISCLVFFFALASSSLDHCTL